jgi:carboxylate-amine ligase
MDSQTRVEHTVALAALVVSLVRRLAAEFAEGREAPDPHWELLDENRWLAARHGLDAELYDFASGTPRAARELTGQLLEELEPHARALGAATQLAGIRDLLRNGNGAARQRMVFEANRDVRELTAEIVASAAVDPWGEPDDGEGAPGGPG